MVTNIQRNQAARGKKSGQMNKKLMVSRGSSVVQIACYNSKRAALGLSPGLMEEKGNEVMGG